MKKIILATTLIFCVLTLHAQSSLSLDSCRRLAIANNKRLQIASEQVKKAHYEKKAAFAQYLPDFSLLGTYMYNQKNLSLLDADKFLPIGTMMPDGTFGFRQDQVNNQWTLVNGQPVPLDANGVPFDPHQSPDRILWKDYTTIPKSEFEMDIKNVWAGVFSVMQPVYMGGKILAYNQLTQYAEDLAVSQKDAGLKEVVLETDEAYWQTISLVNKKKLTGSYVDLLKKMDRDVQELINEGLATKADGLSVRVRLNEAEMAQAKVENGLRMTRMLLSQICGMPSDTVFSLADEEVDQISLSPKIEAADIQEAFQSRPELRSLDLAAKIYEKKEAIVRSDMLPSVALSANYAVTNPNLFNGFQNEFAGMWNVGVVVKVPVFHWGEKMNRLNAAKSETRMKRLEMEEVREKIELQVNQSVFRVNEAEKKMSLSGKNLENASENLRYANVGFEEGVIPVSNVMEAQSAWLKAYSEWIDSQIEMRLSEVYLKKALGKNFME